MKKVKPIAITSNTLCLACGYLVFIELGIYDINEVVKNPISLALLIVVAFILVLSIVGAISNKKDKKIFSENMRSHLSSQEISNEEFQNIIQTLNNKGIAHAKVLFSKIITQKKKDKEIADYLDEVFKLMEKGEISEEDYIEIKNNIYSKGIQWARLFLKQCILKIQLLQAFVSKYGLEKGARLFNKQFFLGMTKDELIDSVGSPTKIETEIMKTKVKEIWIYGNKSSGDVFVFENGLLTRFKDR